MVWCEQWTPAHLSVWLGDGPYLSICSKSRILWGGEEEVLWVQGTLPHCLTWLMSWGGGVVPVWALESSLNPLMPVATTTAFIIL